MSLLKSIFIGYLFAIDFTFSATYYVDNVTGNDGNSGKSTSLPWKTLTKVNGFTFAFGDTISLKCGSRFLVTAPITKKSNITFNSYGSGARPVIDGSSVDACFSFDGQSNIIFNGLKIVKGYSANVGFWNCYNVTIESCNIDSIRGPGSNTIYSGQGANLIIRNSTMNFGNLTPRNGVGSTAIYIDGTDNTLMEYDTLDGNFQNLRVAFGDDTYDVHNKFTMGLIVRYCVIRNGAYDNVDDDGSYNAQFYYNVFETPNTSDYHDNVYIYTNGGGGYLDRSCIGAKYYNNTFIQHKRGQIIDFSGNGQPILVADSLTFKNNIFYYDTPDGYMFYHNAPTKFFTINNNLWFVTNSDHMWMINSNSTTTFSTWQGWGYDKNSIYANPLFTNYAAGDYTLRNGSPAISSGIFVGLTTDINGNSVPSNYPDMGAFQHLTNQ